MAKKKAGGGPNPFAICTAQGKRSGWGQHSTKWKSCVEKLKAGGGRRKRGK